MTIARVLRRFSLLALVFALAFALLPTSTAAGGAGPDVTVVASGLNSPRGLALGDDGVYFVAEAGKGGSGPCQPGPEGGPSCVGLTGRVTRIRRGDLNRLVRLPSHAGEGGFAALGPHDVALSGDDGPLFATVGLGGDAAYRDGYGPKGDLFGTLVRVTRSGHVRVIADLTAYEEATNPDGDIVDSNPYALLRRRGHSIVTDAGGNSLLKVTDRGHITTLAAFPSRLVPFGGGRVPMHSVPTSIAWWNGAYYVSELTGFPFPVGRARIYRVEPGEDPEVWARGFTNIIDIAFHRGHLYVLEIAHNSLLAAAPFGALLRLNQDGSKTVLYDSLFFPTGFAFTGRNTVLVNNCGICPGGGEVLKIEL